MPGSVITCAVLHPALGPELCYSCLGVRLPQVPNVVLRKLPSGAGGASCVAFSTDGTHLAVAASDSPRADPFRLIIYK